MPSSEDRRGQISGRLPLHIFQWLENKIEVGEYPNLNQALIGELTKAKMVEGIHAEILDLRGRVAALEKRG